MIQELETPAAEGCSFPELFGTAMALGALSRCRVYSEAAATMQQGSSSGAAGLPARAAALAAEVSFVTSPLIGKSLRERGHGTQRS